MTSKTSKSMKTRDNKMRFLSTLSTRSCRAVSMHVVEDPVIKGPDRDRTLTLAIDMAVPTQYEIMFRDVLTKLPNETRSLLLSQFTDMVNKTLEDLPVLRHELLSDDAPKFDSINEEERGTEYDQVQDADAEVQTLFRNATQLSTQER